MKASRQNISSWNFWRGATLHAFSFALLSNFNSEIQVDNLFVTLPARVNYQFSRTNFKIQSTYWWSGKKLSQRSSLPSGQMQGSLLIGLPKRDTEWIPRLSHWNCLRACAHWPHLRHISCSNSWIFRQWADARIVHKKKESVKYALGEQRATTLA